MTDKQTKLARVIVIVFLLGYYTWILTSAWSTSDLWYWNIEHMRVATVGLSGVHGKRKVHIAGPFFCVVWEMQKGPLGVDIEQISGLGL